MHRLLALVLIFSAAAGAPRCNIPVFRYALERWPAAPYDVVVFHKGPLTDEIGAALNVLRQAGANLEVDRVNVAEPVPEKRRVLLERLKLDAPCIVALFPGSEIPAWSGPLTAESARRLSDSPARREIAKRLLQGESAVWVLLESGDKSKDDAAAKVLETGSRKLEREMKLPAHAAGDPPLLSEVPLRIAFSVLRLSRTDAEEAAFVGMLLNSDTGLQGPIAFPVFGRARALWAMAGDGLNGDIIGQAGAFIIGACSCEAKEQNPGLDLLVAADWELKLAAAPAPTPIPQPDLKPRPPEPEAAPTPEGSRSYLWGALLVAGLLVAITGRRLISAPKGAR